MALDCPTKLYYASHPDKYHNQSVEDDFLQALAEGGFQVGALAKIYCGVTHDLSELKSYDESLEATNNLLQKHDSVVIAEAAFGWNNCFVRVDVLEKSGNTLHLIEVKAKSFDERTDSFTKKNGGVASDVLPYVYDVAFQKYVVEQAMPGYKVKASLMMADKSKQADIDHLNQLFAIRKDKDGRSVIEVAEDAAMRLQESQTQVLSAFDVDALCERIIVGETPEQEKLMGMPFKDFVKMTSEAHAKKERLPAVLSSKCFGCEFRRGETTLCDGHDECMRREGGFREEDFARPQMSELWGGGRIPKRKFMEQGVYFLDEISEEMYSIRHDGNRYPYGLDAHERTWLQIALATQNEEVKALFGKDLQGNTYLDVDGLRAEMDTWKYPLHMIDFETTAVALPMYKGLRPYEQVAFQYSHHIIERQADGSYTIRHAGQYLNEDVHSFPNYEMVRHLRDELTKDQGTIFRYANHENSILRAIYDQLAQSNELDKEELMQFIDTITHDSDTEHEGERDMVDLLEVVKRYYYQYDEMHGSNSIKTVLPAVLNSSKFLQDKYAEAIYGKDIPSKNIAACDAISWIKLTPEGRVENPYKLLPPVGELIGEDAIDKIVDDDEDMTVANGGAALTAYSKLMFCKDRGWNDALRMALLRYCELDTMAMVFIWEYFHHETSGLK